MTMSEITISGGGILGLTLAFILLERGEKVIVFEKNKIGSGASGGLVGALAPHTPDSWNTKKAFQLASLLKTGPFWARVDEISRMNSGYIRSGRLQTIPDERGLELAWERIGEAEIRWQNNASWRVIPSESPSNWGEIGSGELIVEDSLSALINPRNALQSLAKSIRSLGGQIYENETRPEIHQGPHVDATGYAGLQGFNLGNGQKGQGALLQYDARNFPQLFTNGVHIIPHLDGTVAIGSTSENEWSNVRPDTAINELVEKARILCPCLRDAPLLETWAGIRPRGRRRTPILGRLPDSDTFILNGGFKIGYGIAVESADRLADLILTGDADIPNALQPQSSL